jgi:hypothetical protein
MGKSWPDLRAHLDVPRRVVLAGVMSLLIMAGSPADPDWVAYALLV